MSRPERCIPVLPLWPALLVLTTAGCRRDMHDGTRLKPLEASTFFIDGRSARPLVPGTVARGHLHEDDAYYTGMEGGKLVDAFPVKVDLDLLRRGRERYEIFCAPCHDRIGGGQGIVVRRGFRRPPAFHDEAVLKKPPGYFFDVITRGFGVMPDFADQISPADRWAIAAHIRVLERSQRASRKDVPTDVLAKLGASR